MTQTRLIDELNDLHASYVDAVNTAVAQGDLELAQELAGRYDRDAIELMAEREGRQDLLPLFGLGAGPRDTPLRRLVRRLSTRSAA